MSVKRCTFVGMRHGSCAPLFYEADTEELASQFHDALRLAERNSFNGRLKASIPDGVRILPYDCNHEVKPEKGRHNG